MPRVLVPGRRFNINNLLTGKDEQKCEEEVQIKDMLEDNSIYYI